MAKKRRASIISVDFTNVKDHRQYRSGILGSDGKVQRRADGSLNPPRLPDGKLLTPKQIRARARRRARRAEMMTDEEFHAIYKPIEEWDLEELARGRPKNAAGRFSGATPSWISREVHERSMTLFKQAIKTEMNALTPKASDVLEWVMTNDEVDDKGKPIVPASTKLDAAKFLFEHTVGKPTQRVESDVSVRLQSILGVVMANPAQALAAGPTGYNVGHLPGVTMPMGVSEDVIDADVEEEDG